MGEIFWLAALLGAGAALSVGPVTVTILNEAATRGFKPAFRVILGSATADLILMLPALAFGWLIATIVHATFWVGLVGAAFFVYLAVQAVRDARRLWREGQAPQTHGWAFWKGVGANLANPLTWTFWLATGTPMMIRAQHLAGRTGLAVFTVTWFTVASGVEAIVALAVSRAGHNFSHRGQGAFTALSAILFAALAGMMLVRNVIS
jgi:threonine/homoserine/homoserine lactone efflux protein